MSDRPWLAAYPAGIPAEVDERKYPSLVDLLRAKASACADMPAFSNRGTTLSYRAIDELSGQFSAYLQSLEGLARGDRVAVMMPNLLQSPVVLFGILRAGLVVVNINPMYTAFELKHQLRDSGAKAIVVLENFADTLSAVLEESRLELVVLTSVGDPHPAAKRVLTNFVVRHVKRLVPSVDIETAVRYRDALSIGSKLVGKDVESRSDELAFLQYTGGTTGVSKGAMLTHGNIVSNVLQMSAWARPFFDPARGVVVTPLPLYHVFALTVGLLGFFELGGHNLLITDPRELEYFVSELRRYPFAYMIGVNTLFNALLHTPGFAELDFSRLTICLAGGMAVQRDVAERWQQTTGRVIAQGYGLTEASPVVSANPLDTNEFDGSVGLPLPSTDVAIFDDEGNMLPTGGTAGHARILGTTR
jgi:long-chain acyl-CoA synthetase